MKFVALCHIKPGMVLARPIYNKNNVTLLGRNVTLTETFCNKMQELSCVKGIYVYDEYDLIDKKEFKDVVDEKTRKAMVERNENFHLDAVTFFGTSIVNNAQNSSRVSHLLLDIYNYSIETFEHSIRVAEIAVTMGIGLGYSNQELSNLATAALLHDIGKIKIDSSIISKNGQLTPEERTIINQHTLLGYEILKNNPRIDSTIKCGILMHHENEDGSGYPKGIKGNEIYKFAKIIHIADVYDALISNRTYKKAFDTSNVIEYMMSKANIVFDLEMLKVFLKYVEIFKVGDRVVLSTNEIALVVENHHNYMLRPTIELNDEKIDLSTNKNYLNVVVKRKYEE